MELKQCILTKNNCYKKNQKITPKGIIVHSTGANNPTLKRYVQPDDGLLGKNLYNNDWNRPGLTVCVHAFIGKDKNGDVQVYQTLPFNIACWGVGSGKKGSYNYNPAYIQFEICEDNLTNKDYFDKCFKLAAEFCAYLMKEYNIGIDNVISHHEAYLRGYGSNHGDCDHWLKKFGKTMNDFRNDVKELLGDKPEDTSNNNDSSYKTFVKDVQKAIGANVDGIAGPETLSKTITVSKSKNRRHAVVKALQTYFKALGYDIGSYGVDGCIGNDMTKVIKQFQKDNGCIVDGVITAKQLTWQKLLKLK